jgi:hypothetical protein
MPKWPLKRERLRQKGEEEEEEEEVVVEEEEDEIWVERIPQGKPPHPINALPLSLSLTNISISISISITRPCQWAAATSHRGRLHQSNLDKP